MNIHPSPSASFLAAQYAAVQARIDAACAAHGRVRAQVQLLAVSKTFPAQAVQSLAELGHTAFGENYVQEGVDKITHLAPHWPHLDWHFIGPLQSNKTRKVAEHFAWVHSVDRLSVAQRLAQQRPPHLPALRVCLQVNISAEASKSGVAPEQLLPLAQAVLGLPRLHLCGLMAIPEPSADLAHMRQRFAQVRECRDQLEQRLGWALPTLSMGMSEDLEPAIAEGATWIRVGRALFGARTPVQSPPEL